MDVRKTTWYGKKPEKRTASRFAVIRTLVRTIERGQLLMHGPIDEVYRRIRRNRLIEIKFVDRMDIGLSIIRSMPETRDVRIEDHRATIELQADDSKVAELLEHLMREGVRI